MKNVFDYMADKLEGELVANSTDLPKKLHRRYILEPKIKNLCNDLNNKK